MDDRDVLHRINELAEEEEHLWGRAGEVGGLTAEDEAHVRPAEIVENYEQ